MRARIHSPARSAMQSGQARSDSWELEFEVDDRREIEPLMGWTSSSDTRRQVRLSFETKEAAVAYAEAAGIPYVVFEPKVAKRRRMAYSDNFRHDRVGQWTH